MCADVIKTLKEKTGAKHGVDVGIDAVGMHYAKTLTHKVELAVGLESDSADIIAEIINSVRKARYCNASLQNARALMGIARCAKHPLAIA